LIRATAPDFLLHTQYSEGQEAEMLEGYAVLVTGGGSGIGFACAERLASDGAAVTICGRTEETLRDAVRRIGGSAAYVVADVTVEDDVRAAVAKALEPTGSLDGVVANAGGGGMPAPYHRQEAEEFVRVLHLNVLSTMLCIKHSVAHLASSGRGSFVGMSSLAGHRTHRYFGAYPVAKAGIQEMVRNAADEYGHLGVRFNVVQPGFTETELMALIPRDGSVYQSYIDNTPMRGVADPSAVADVVRFLIGAESRWVTGETIAVDGGHHLRAGPDFTPFAGVDDDPLLNPD
jgi:NAD(P)-dependent dehydrogenase (short-subunit alcohol dehydrogenase family)